MKIRAEPLDPNHYWTAKPGNRILIVDSGGVRFEFPGHWILWPRAMHPCLVDQEPPATRCSILVSCRRISLGAAETPLMSLMKDVIDSESRPVTARGEVVRIIRPALEAAWIGMHVVDGLQGGEACTRICLARSGCTIALIAFDALAGDEKLFDPVWATVMETLVVGDYIDDPATGRRREKRG